MSSFLHRATSSAAPLTCVALLLAVRHGAGARQELCRQLAAPPNKVNPSATTSSLRLSRALKAARSMSLTLPLVDTRAPPSQQTCAAATSGGHPLRPTSPRLRARCSGWLQGRGRCNLLHMRRRGWASILTLWTVLTLKDRAGIVPPWQDLLVHKFVFRLPCCGVRDQRPTQMEILDNLTCPHCAEGRHHLRNLGSSSLRWQGDDSSECNPPTGPRTRWTLFKPSPPAESAKLDNTCAVAGALGVP